TSLSLQFNDTGVVSGIAGTVTYTGELGTVSTVSHLIVAAFANPNDFNGEPSRSDDVKINGGRFDILTLNTNTYYVLAFLDLNRNFQFDGGEPFSIYQNKSTGPGDPLVAGTTSDVTISFGDENL